jgi:menaquinone-dependent protoporphyrinogen oxidase
MANVMIVYGSMEGQAEKIAEALAAAVRSAGHGAHVVDARFAPSEAGPFGYYDGVIVGSSVHAGKFHPAVVDWCERNAEKLKSRPTAFFSVSLSVLEKRPEAQADLRRITDQLFAKSGWTAGMSASIAGALKYTSYGWLKRMMMRMISRKAGGDTDTSRDYEYTDWAQVAELGREFAKRLPTAGAEATGQPKAAS